MKLNLPQALQEATRLTRAGHLGQATAAIRRMLASPGGAVPPQPGPAQAAPASAAASKDAAEASQFLIRTFSNQAGSRPYRLFIPSGYHGQPVPLIVMLHGCTQSPEDFAVGSGMNQAAEASGCLVAYPGQTKAANAQKCWNWFNPGDQRRDAGEPSLIAGITRTVMSQYAIDPARVYVGGMSAGGAAASIMGQVYPDLYAAVGVHSGLACGAARDMQSGFAAMQRGGNGSIRPDKSRNVPTIVFHGEGDGTVSPSNGDAVVAQAVQGMPLRTRVESGQQANGHPFTRTLFVDANGKTFAEHWVVRGAGHAWLGGSPAGSYTDPRGPDATAEMMRFFLQHTLT